MALDRPYCTINDVKDYVGIDASDCEKDRAIEDAINRASRWIDSFTGQIFYKKSVTDEYATTVDSDGWFISNEFVFTPWKPIISITSLSESGSVLTENTDFYVDKEIGRIIKASGSWATDPRSIKVTGSFGYNAADTESVASDIDGKIRQACIATAATFSGLDFFDVEQDDGNTQHYKNIKVPEKAKMMLLDYQNQIA